MLYLRLCGAVFAWFGQLRGSGAGDAKQVPVPGCYPRVVHRQWVLAAQFWFCDLRLVFCCWCC